jgi:hypothetical protein
MAVSPKELVLAAVAFVLIAILTPIALQTLIQTRVDGWNASVITIWQVLLPVMFVVGAALYFIPKIGK